MWMKHYYIIDSLSNKSTFYFVLNDKHFCQCRYNAVKQLMDLNRRIIESFLSWNLSVWVSPAETETNVCVSLLWCFVLEKSLEVNRYPTCEKTRNYFMKSDQFSEGVMNVSSEIAWGIIRDNSCFLLKKRGELHQDDFSWTLAMLKSRFNL